MSDEEKLNEELQDEPPILYKEFMDDLYCHCCGDKISTLNYPVAVINPYECLCLSCFRGDYTSNAETIKTNANIYRLRQDLKNKYEHTRMERDMWRCTTDSKIKETEEECKIQFKELVDEIYEDALRFDSATAIELLNNLKEKLENEKNK